MIADTRKVGELYGKRCGGGRFLSPARHALGGDYPSATSMDALTAGRSIPTGGRPATGSSSACQRAVHDLLNAPRSPHTSNFVISFTLA